MTRNPRTPALFLAVLVAVLAAGCGKSPTAPETAVEPPAPEIKTPAGVIVSSIAVTRFPATAPDGSNWDSSLIASYRRPDLYVSLTVPGAIPNFTSETVTNAEQGKVYTFTKAASAYDGSLPHRLAYDASHRIYVMDADVGGDPDRVGWITVNVPAAYGNDNANGFDHTYIDSGKRLYVRVRGTWVY